MIAMTQKKTRQHGAFGETRCPKGSGNGNTGETVSVATSTGSYSTTEDLTDTDTSLHIRRKSSRDNDNSRVRFKMSSNKLHKVASHNDFSAKERGNYWWSDREKDRMMAKHERLVAKYEQQRSATKPGTLKKISADKLGSYRGLESWTAAGSLKLDHTIEQCISAVMDEQDRQWNENDDDGDVIAEKSFTVTEDSARRARLNGLQDAQEALRIRGENWSKKSPSDEISVGSTVSTGTAALVKKKKRSKLLARLDDSYKTPRSTIGSEKKGFLVDVKKESKKSKKAKKTKKSKKIKKTKSRDKDTDIKKTDDGDSDTKTTYSTTVASHIDDQDRKPMNDVAVPVSPLRTPETSNDVYPLLAALRLEQEKLKQNSSRSQDDTIASIYGRQPALEHEEDDIVKLLRDQQKKQALTWASRQRGDSIDDGNLGIPIRSGDPVSKLSSLREDYTKAGYSEHANMSDPPGRRPKRLTSRYGVPENASPRPYDTKDTQALRMPKLKAPAVDGIRSRSNRDVSSGRKGLDLFRNGAKTLFKKGAKA